MFTAGPFGLIAQFPAPLGVWVGVQCSPRVVGWIAQFLAPLRGGCSVFTAGPFGLIAQFPAPLGL
ncbi:hypothetical protein ASR50_08295 [Streptomyces sp. 4F]|nr:hypothetical protein ASR50_08295 [Streptomyces sp. 4F]